MAVLRVRPKRPSNLRPSRNRRQRSRFRILPKSKALGLTALRRRERF